MTWVMWNLTSLSFETVLVSAQDRGMVRARHTTGLEIILDAPMVPLGDELKWKLISVHLKIVLILTQDRSTVCIERTIGSKIVLDTLDGTLR